MYYYNIYKCDNYVSLETYIASLVAVGNKKAQVINMNLEDIDDTHAKIIVKIIARIFFDFCKTLSTKVTCFSYVILCLLCQFSDCTDIGILETIGRPNR